MFFDPQCIPCIVKQAYNAAVLFTDGDKDLQLKIIKEVAREIEKINPDFTAPMFSGIIQNVISQNTGLKEPYKNIKAANLEIAKKYIPYLQTMIESSFDKLETAVRAAILGNVIDLGANPDFNIEQEVNKITLDNFNLDSYQEFRKKLYESENILYIGDNYEEALFDKLLIKELLPKKIVFAVRSEHILNDLTYEDAVNLGIDKLCKVIKSGSRIAGTDLRQATEEFLEMYNSADMIISKGQGNYETLLNENKPIVFMFKVKCDAIAKRSGFPVGTSALLINK